MTRFCRIALEGFVPLFKSSCRKRFEKKNSENTENKRSKGRFGSMNLKNKI